MAEKVWERIEEDVRHQRSEEAKAHGGRLAPASAPSGTASMLQSEIDHAAHAPNKSTALHNLKKAAQLYTAIEADEAPDGNIHAGSDASKLKGLIDRNKFHGKAPAKKGAIGDSDFMGERTVPVIEGGKVVREREPAA